MARGGYRKPANPAPVSGPGALSRRTDGGPSQPIREMAGGKYGERKETAELQASAPMANRRQPQPMPNRPPITPLLAPTERPDEPITTGMPFGPGPGPEVLGGNNRERKLSSVIEKIMPNDPTGELYVMYDYLISRGL